MNIELIKQLKNNDVIPLDADVVQSKSNLVVCSEKSRLVYRISSTDKIKNSLNPCNIAYSHRLAWDLAEYVPVLAPISPEPTIWKRYILSCFPTVQTVSYVTVKSEQVVRFVEKFNVLQSSFPVKLQRKLRNLNVENYVAERINMSVSKISPAIHKCYEFYISEYPFRQLGDIGLVHGDMHFGNLVLSHDNLLAIDLDSIALGPVLYDIASWHVRRYLWDCDKNVLDRAVTMAKRKDREVFNALCGWKIISSLSYILCFGYSDRFDLSQLLHCGRSMNLPWFNELQNNDHLFC